MWRNWTGDQSCAPARRSNPTTAAEVAAALVDAGSRGETVRVVGAGHSFGDNVVTDGTLMSLDALAGMQVLDAAEGRVRVAAGTRLFDLNRLLDEHGLAMANLGDINVQSAAGAISTGTHGTGAALGNLATFVESAEIVTADGSIRELSGDELRAARISVGALGVITAYTLRTVPAFKLHERRDRMPLTALLRDLDGHVHGNDHFEFFIFPHATEAITKGLNRTDEPAGVRSKARAYVEEVVLENYALDVLSRAGRRFPTQIPRLNRLVTSLASPSDKVNHSYDVFSSPRMVRFTESEWAFPRETAPEALQEIMAMITRRGFDINFPIEVRFVAGDTDSMLSPAYGRDTTYLAVHAYQDMAWREYFSAVQEIALAHGARPHWGKRHSLDADTLSTLYPEWEAFNAVRTDLDPEGRFANAHITRIFGS